MILSAHSAITMLRTRHRVDNAQTAFGTGDASDFPRRFLLPPERSHRLASACVQQRGHLRGGQRRQNGATLGDARSRTIVGCEMMAEIFARVGEQLFEWLSPE